MKILKNFKRKIKSISGNSLAEFAVTTAMMATLATTAAPRFSGIGEGAKEKKTLSEIDKIVIASSNFFNSKVTTEGRGRFPGQERYDVQVGGYASEIQLLDVIGSDASDATSFDGYDNSEGSNWRSIFGKNDATAGIATGSLVTNDDGSTVGHEEFLAEFANNSIKSPYQDGHYIYIVLPGGLQYVDPDGDGTYVKIDCNDCSPILYVADNEAPSKLFKKYQP
tara:strand:+ start:1788 stop:2456 length:669 start_codon:yes stop_codon:yes gene_type:complete